MRAIIDWAAERSRMTLGVVLLILGLGAYAYVGLPKEGDPDIDVPALIIRVPFPGISAADSERLLIRPIEQEMAGLSGLRKMTATAARNYAVVVLEFDFDWDKSATIAEVRDRMSRAQAKFPDGAENYVLDEFNFSAFPAVIVAVSGQVPERTLLAAARELEAALEALPSVLSANVAGARDEMVEVVIDPLRLEAYNVTAGELIRAITQNNLLVAAGDIMAETGSFSVALPGTFQSAEDIYALPIKVNGDGVVTLGDLAEIRPTFADRVGLARFQGEPALALQVVKRKGFNMIDTVADVRRTIERVTAAWPEEKRAAISVTAALDRSVQVRGMIAQLEGSVLTAIALVMIVVLAALGARSAFLVGLAIPTSFLLTFILLGILGVTISNIVMFALILAVGMLVDGAVVVVESAEKRMAEGQPAMAAYVQAARRMFWPIVSSTATTLCAFLPMLFWPGVAGEFMGMLPLTLIFVLSASLIVALVLLPPLGGFVGALSQRMGQVAQNLRKLPLLVRLLVLALSLGGMLAGALAFVNPAVLGLKPGGGVVTLVPGAVMFCLAALAFSVAWQAVKPHSQPSRVPVGHRRTLFGWVIKAIVGNPVMPLVALGIIGFGLFQIYSYYAANNRGVQFFVDTEPEQGILYIRARGNLSLAEKDALVRQVEALVLQEPGIAASFAFVGTGGLNANTAGAPAPRDAIGQINFEFQPWAVRDGYPELRARAIVARLQEQFAEIPGIFTEFRLLEGGPVGQKPVHLRLIGTDFATLDEAVRRVRAEMEAMPGLFDIEDTRPLPGIEWEVRVDTNQAMRFGVDVATIGGMVQLVTRGLLLDTMRVEGVDEEIEIRVRLPEANRLLSTLDSLRVPTLAGLVPLSNFVTVEPVPLRGQIDRFNESRFFDIKADVTPNLISVQDQTGAELQVLPRAAVTPGEHPAGSAERDAAERLRAELLEQGLRLVPITASERIARLTSWLQSEGALPTGISWQWTGEQQDQEESARFLTVAFGAALGLMFAILLAQFNSFYNAVLVLLAVVLSTAGVLVGMLVMDQPFSVIMTGTGIVALAGIVVNNNIVLIDTFQEYSRTMAPIEAIVRTVEDRLRPVFLTTITTMAGLAPMMLGISIDFFVGGYTVDAPAAMWWKPLATAVFFGLGFATLLTLVVTPSLLALRVWVGRGLRALYVLLRALVSPQVRADGRLRARASKVRGAEIIWEVAAPPRSTVQPLSPPSVEEERLRHLPAAE